MQAKSCRPGKTQNLASVIGSPKCIRVQACVVISKDLPVAIPIPSEQKSSDFKELPLMQAKSCRFPDFEGKVLPAGKTQNLASVIGSSKCIRVHRMSHLNTNFHSRQLVARSYPELSS